MGGIGRVEVGYVIKITHTGTTAVEGAPTPEAAKQEVLTILALDGWARVDNEKLVLEVERVYETRWDCMAMPEGVRRAA